jgi:PAS domain S-box-containing protein
MKNKSEPDFSTQLQQHSPIPQYSKIEERYRDFLKNVHDGFFELDLSGKFIFINDSVCKLVGYSRDELLGTRYRKYTNKENARKVFEEYHKVYITGEPSKGFGWQITRKDGVVRYIETSVSLQRDSSGNPTGFVGIVNDITERKDIEEKLRSEEQLFRALTEQSSDLIILINRKFKVAYVNPAVAIYLGLKNDDLIGSDIYNYIHPDDLGSVAEIFGKFFSNTHPNTQKTEIRIYNTDGTWHMVEAVGTSLIQDNTVQAVIINLHDITQRKMSQEMLKKSEEQYRLLADHMKDQIWLMDLKLNITYVSPSVERLFGYTPDEIKKLTWEKLLTPESLKKALYFTSVKMPKAMREASKDLIFRTLELEFMLGNGQTSWGECSFSFIRNEHGKAVSILGESRDISERKKIENELRASESNFRHSLDDSPLGVRISTVESETIYANRAMLDIYGYDNIKELKNTPLEKRYTPESYKEWQARKTQRRNGEISPSEYEISIVRKDGMIRHLHVFRKEIFWDDRIRSQVIYQDITERRKVEEQLRQTLENLRESIKVTIHVLGMASEAKDPYTAGHQKRVSDLARAIAHEMDLSHDMVEGIRMAGSIHDIGKLSVPAEILSRPTKLSDLEYSMIKEHSRSGFEMLKHVESPWPLAEIVLQHHERMNGLGYPQKLKGDDIIIEARILAVADVVEAMSSHRPYRASLGLEVALDEIEKNRGVLYDEYAVDSCLNLFRAKGYQLA